MKFHFAFILIFLVITWPVMAENPSFVWSNHVGSTNDDKGKSVATDSFGNIYYTGTFRGTTDFDPGLSSTNLTSNGFDDIFISKLDGEGNLIWAISLGGDGYDEPYAITTDVLGNVYSIGTFQGSVDFDPGTDTTLLNANNAYASIYILKLDSDGNFVWAASFGENSTNVGTSIFVDDLGYVYSTGHFQGTIDFDPGPETENLTVDNGIVSAFILKLDSDGNFVWVKNFSGLSNTDDSYGDDIVVDDMGNVYTTGFFFGIVDFDPSTNTNYYAAVASADIYISKLDNEGNLVWASNFGSIGYDQGISLKLDASGNLYAAGFFSDVVDFDSSEDVYDLTSNGSDDIFLIKLDDQNNLKWAKNIGGVSSDFPYYIDLDAEGNIYTIGLFQGMVDFDPSSEIMNLSSNGSYDFFISKMDSSGSFVWANNFGNSFDDIGKYIALDLYGNIYAVGTFEGTVDFNPSTSVVNLTSNGGADAFILKLSEENVTMLGKEKFEGIKIYPNPASEKIVVENKHFSNSAKLMLSDMLGRTKKTIHIKSIQSIIDISDMDKGTYMAQIPDWNFTKMVIKN